MTGTTTRRRLRAVSRPGLILAAATALAAPVALPSPAQAVALACNGAGAVYAVDSSGKLLRSDMPTPASGGTLPTPGQIDTGWQVYGRMLAGRGATFYGIRAEGLYVSHRVGATGQWDVHHKQLSPNFGWLRNSADRNQVTVDRTNHIWVLDNDGYLRWYKFDTATGDQAAGSGEIMDRGWNRYDLIVTTDDGVLYGRDAGTGHLYRSRFDYSSQRWLERHVVESTADWRQYSKGIFSNGGDTLIGVKGTGEVRFYRFDEDVRDFAVYDKKIASSGWHNYPNTSGAPDSCRLDVNHSPTGPAAPLESYTPLALMQSSSGALEYAYTDNIGRLVHGRQPDPADTNGVQWTVVSGNDAYTGTPSLISRNGGLVSVTAHNTSGSIAHLIQKAQGSADWDPWRNLAGAMGKHPAVARTPGGLLTVFSTDSGGKPWYRLQAADSTRTVSGWMPLSGSGLSGPLTAVTVRDGIQLFGKDGTGKLTTALFKDNGTLSAWTSPGNMSVQGKPSVVVYPGYRIRVFATGTDGQVHTTAQSAEGGAYGAWSALGGIAAAGAPNAVISPVSGKTEVMVRDTDGRIRNTGEVSQGSGTWRDWQTPSDEVAATDPTAFTYTNAGGSTWAYAFRDADNQVRLYRLDLSAASSSADEDEVPRFTGHTLPAPPRD